ncbi:hypothetical protein [Gordonia prachuapensis]
MDMVAGGLSDLDFDKLSPADTAPLPLVTYSISGRLPPPLVE